MFKIKKRRFSIRRTETEGGVLFESDRVLVKQIGGEREGVAVIQKKLVVSFGN